MTPSEYAELTRNVIRDQGFADFIPTACFPARRELRGLSGIPAAEQTEQTVLTWAGRLAQPDEEYLVALKISPTEFKVIRRQGSETDQAVFLARAD